MIDPKKVCLFFPKGCGTSKGNLYRRIGESVGQVTRHIVDLQRLPDDIIPMIGGTTDLHDLVQEWKGRKRNFIYWDSGYFRRLYEAWLPRGEGQGAYYRMHFNSFQMRRIRLRPRGRYEALEMPTFDWRKNDEGDVVVAPSMPSYDYFHGCFGWQNQVVERVRDMLPNNKVVVRHRNSETPLLTQLMKARCLVTHGSNAANEAIVMGCPVVAIGDCAAGLVGRRRLDEVKDLIYPERSSWMNSLAYSQFTEEEILDGSAFRMMDDGGPE